MHSSNLAHQADFTLEVKPTCKVTRSPTVNFAQLAGTCVCTGGTIAWGPFQSTCLKDSNRWPASPAILLIFFDHSPLKLTCVRSVICAGPERSAPFPRCHQHQANRLLIDGIYKRKSDGEITCLSYFNPTLFYQRCVAYQLSTTPKPLPLQLRYYENT